MRFMNGYSKWKGEHQSVLETFRGKHILTLFSGGKDSSLALDLMLKGAAEFGFDLEVHAGAFPVHRYRDADMENIHSYWLARGVRIKWHPFAETDEDIETAENPCVPCRDIRKKKLKEIVSPKIRDRKSLILVTSYSLWDIASYAIEHILGDVFAHSTRSEDTEIRSFRFKETAQRFYPLIKMQEGYTIFRPLIKYNGSDIEAFIKETNIPILTMPCKYRQFIPKRILESYYTKMGLHFHYDRVLNFAKQNLELPDISEYASLNKEEYLRKLF